MVNINTSVIRKIGIVFLVLVFVMSSYNKITNVSKNLKTIAGKNIPFPHLALAGAIGFQLLGYLGILGAEFNYIDSKFGFIGAWLLIVFTAMATFYFHNPLVDPSQKLNLVKNLSIIGGLMILSSSYQT